MWFTWLPRRLSPATCWLLGACGGSPTERPPPPLPSLEAFSTLSKSLNSKSVLATVSLRSGLRSREDFWLPGLSERSASPGGVMGRMSGRQKWGPRELVSAPQYSGLEFLCKNYGIAIIASKTHRFAMKSHITVTHK